MGSGRLHVEALITTVALSAIGKRRGHTVALVHCFALAAAAVVIALTAGTADWNAPQLAVIAALTIASELTSIETGSAKLRVSGSFLGIMLAAVLLGGGPAALVGVVTIAVGRLSSREEPHYFRNNLVTYVWFPLAGGLFFNAAVRVGHVGAHDLGYYVLVFVAFVLALALNFVMVAGYQCHLDRSRLAEKVHEALRPVLASEMFSAAFTMVAVYVAVELGTIGLLLFALILVVFQYLVSELLVSQRRSEKLHRIATIDELTGLANRERFRERVDDAVASCQQADRAFAVMLIDLDRFKEINDELGHEYGDVLLGELGPRLAACVGPAGFVARLGGDEFAVLPGRRGDEPQQLEQLAAKLLTCVQQPFLVEELSLEVGASLGISRFPRDGTDARTLLRRANIAMSAAKRKQSGFALYEAEQDHHSRRRLSVLSDFRHALDADQLVVHYQPIVDILDRRVRGAEALVRWQHPSLGLLQPAAFLPIVEQTGLIRPLTHRVLDVSIAQCAAWRRAGQELTVAVNLSVRNLLEPTLPKEIERMLSEHSLAPEALQLEITESMIMSDPERALVTVSRLSALGVRLSVDDFGTGHSSLANLRRLPINELKIDRSFVSPMLNDESDLVIVRSTINLGHDLGLKIIAEGVEDESTLTRLGFLGCDLAQGYHLSRPIPPQAFADWLRPADVRPLDDARPLELGGHDAARAIRVIAGPTGL
jgi:diguanylate cyclase (GGDEF)-like protein